MADDYNLDYIDTGDHPYYTIDDSGYAIPDLPGITVTSGQGGITQQPYTNPYVDWTPPGSSDFGTPQPTTNPATENLGNTGLLSGAASGLASIINKLGLNDPQVIKMLGLAGGLVGTYASGKNAQRNNPTFNPPALFGGTQAQGAAGQSPYTFVNYLQTPQARTPVVHLPTQGYANYGSGAENSFYHAAGGKIRGALSQELASRHVKGPGDGTSDSIPALINGTEPAKIASGEYIVSADAVSHLGNGDNDAGAKKLDAFMSNIRKHKAKNMSKGKLPHDAKSVSAYMRAAK